MPNQFIYKEYSFHERVYLTPLMLKHLHLWLPNNSFQHRFADLPPPDFDSSLADAPSRIKLLSLSATGISARIDALDRSFVNYFENKHILFRLTLYRPMRKEFSILAFGRCTNIFHAAVLQRMSLWLQFTAVCNTDASGRNWLNIHENGVHAIAAWIQEDYAQLLEKRRNLFSYAMPHWLRGA